MAPKRKSAEVAPSANEKPAPTASEEGPDDGAEGSGEAVEPSVQGSQQKQPKVEDLPIEVTIKPQQEAEDGSDGSVMYRVRSKVLLSKLFEKYCAKAGVDPRAVKFYFEGKRLSAKRTLAQSGLKDGAVIDAQMFQVAGSL